MSLRPAISVVIPTHDRSDLLCRALDALSAQTLDAEAFEVIVVADGCTDGTVAAVESYEAPYRLRVVERAGAGANAARNAGAKAAAAGILLFLDDDVHATPQLVSAHVQEHTRGWADVVVGPYPPQIDGSGLHENELRNWWLAKFEEMAQDGFRHTYRSLLTGNMSIAAAQFQRLGGLNEKLLRNEDYEFGIRVVRAGLRFVVAADAVGHHLEQSTLDRSYEHKRKEGATDVVIAQRYPEVIASLPFVERWHSSGSALDRVIVRLTFGRFPARRMANFLRRFAEPLERMGWTGAWRALHRLLLAVHYWRGVVDQAGAPAYLRELIDLGSVPPRRPGSGVEIDLRDGIEEAERHLDELRPVSVHLRYGAARVGVIRYDPIAERLHGGHLRPYLLRELPSQFLEALALQGAIVDDPTKREALARSIRSKSDDFGPPAPQRMWQEHYRQWQRFEHVEDAKSRSVRRQWEYVGELARDTIWLEEHGGMTGGRGRNRRIAGTRLLVWFLIDVLALTLVAPFVPGLRDSASLAFLAVACAFAALSGAVRPFLFVLTVPILLPAIPVMLVLTDACVLSAAIWGAGVIGFEPVSVGLGPLFAGALSVSVVRIVLARLTREAERGLGAYRMRRWIRRLERYRSWLSEQVAAGE